MCNFVHLHVHTARGSALDGMARVDELLDTAKSLGQDTITISDHGSMSALWEAQEYGDKIGVKVIHACEFYYEYDEPFEKKKHGHLLVLAKNDVGLRNMFLMHKWATKENFHRNPRINWEVLKEHAEGLIVTSACLASEFNQFIMAGRISEAKAWAKRFKETFGDDFYIELQPNSVPEQHLCNTTGIRIAQELGIEVVATNDVHYTLEDDCFPHEVLLAMQFNNKMDSPKRFKFPTEDFWLKSESEMYETFTGLDDATVKTAIDNTRVVADKCLARIEKGHYLPTYYDIPEGETQRSLLAKKIMSGLKERGLHKDKSFVQPVQHELNVIDRNGYSGYFLIVQDFVTSAKARGELVGDGRGSGAGSKVAYTTRITEIPPHEYDLLFERFMADGREPDFDVDFSDQQAVFKDLQKKYGVDNVSRIIAFGTLAPKAVARKVMSTFGHDEFIQGQISKLIPEGCKNLFDAISTIPELKVFAKRYPTEFRVMERLQNITSHLSQHAGGILIYPDLGKHLPLTWDRDNEIYVAGFDKKMLEALGHFKFDILGLETLPILHGMLESINASPSLQNAYPEVEHMHDVMDKVESTTGKVVDITKIDLEDQGVYDMLCAGDVSGVFQLANQSNKVIQQQPRSFRDLIAINALIRPGVGDWNEYIERRNGKEWSIYEPRKPYMDETVGTMTYQEQYLLDAHILAGWDIAYADKHIRKNRDIQNDVELRTKFLCDGQGSGHDKQILEEVWKEIESAVDGGYSFNKSHSASYAMLSYQTAYLKYHYPEHFYASQMSGAKTDGVGQNEIATYIAECKRRGIAILPPHINDSTDKFVVTDSGIAYRITTIKHVGDSAIHHINDLRPIRDFDDFIARREKASAKSNVVKNLIKAGAFDFDEPNRARLLWRFDMANRTKKQIKEEFQCEEYEWNDAIKMQWEKEVLGMYLTAHPMDKYGFQSIDTFIEGGNALIGGEVIDVYEFHPQKNPAKPKMAFVSLNTLQGTVKVVVFARQWKDPDTQEACSIGNIVLVRGKRSGNDITFDSMEVLE